jgi:DNA recombination protein RmuC
MIVLDGLPAAGIAALAGLALALAAVLLLIVLLRRFPADLPADVERAASKAVRGGLEPLERGGREEIARLRRETAFAGRQGREELRAVLGHLTDALLKRMSEIARLQKGQLDSFSRQLAELTAINEAKIESVRRTVEHRLQVLEAGTAQKLEQMRLVVDDKLQSTLEKRLGDSFRQVSERLEQVYAGLGEMRTLAAGVGDLKRVLANVKARGTWGEIRLGQILEQILTPEQYAANVAPKPGGDERVEFAVRLPGPGREPQAAVWLPIDAKFPQEDYQRLMEAREAADRELAERSLKNLEGRMRAEARAIREKYIAPPHTTDFAILFLPVEGLYAEVLQVPGLVDALQREQRVVVAGPTTLAALLNSLQMGFRTLAVERRSSEVWELLSLVKAEFGRFGDTLSKTKKKLDEAARSIDRAESRSRAIERRLRRVEDAPADARIEPAGGSLPAENP